MLFGREGVNLEGKDDSDMSGHAVAVCECACYGYHRKLLHWRNDWDTMEVRAKGTYL